MRHPEANLRAAERIAGLLSKLQVECVVIGAIAMAAHRYIRHTEDIDLAVNADLSSLRAATELLQSEGFDVLFHEADGDDPLGGVIDVRGDFGLVQVVSFAGRFPIVIDDALVESDMVLGESRRLRLSPLPHLVALKLYAGGMKSKADIVELLRRNPELDREALRQKCAAYRLKGLEDLIREADDVS